MLISKRFRSDLDKESDRVLTGLLLALAIATILVAIAAPRLVKIGVLAWEVLP